MSVRMRSTSGKRGSRHSHHKIKEPQLVKEGDIFRRRHHASRITGMFKGKSVLNIKEKKEKEEVTDEKITQEQAKLPENVTEGKKTIEQAEIPKS